MMADVNLDRLAELAEKAAEYAARARSIDQENADLDDVDAFMDDWLVHVKAFREAADPVTVKALVGYARRLETVAEAARRFLDLDFGYLSEPTKEALEPVIAALSGLDGDRANGESD